jgi:hypothetical protein
MGYLSCHVALVSLVCGMLVIKSVSTPPSRFVKNIDTDAIEKKWQEGDIDDEEWHEDTFEWKRKMQEKIPGMTIEEIVASMKNGKKDAYLEGEGGCENCQLSGEDFHTLYQVIEPPAARKKDMQMAFCTLHPDATANKGKRVSSCCCQQSGLLQCFARVSQLRVKSWAQNGRRFCKLAAIVLTCMQHQTMNFCSLRSMVASWRFATSFSLNQRLRSFVGRTQTLRKKALPHPQPLMLLSQKLRRRKREGQRAKRLQRESQTYNAQYLMHCMSRLRLRALFCLCTRTCVDCYI